MAKEFISSEITWETLLSMTPDKLLILILFGASWALYFIFIHSSTSYLKKKGENLALTQDIQKLTTLVKGAEQTFTDRTENLKQQLDLSKQMRLGIHSDERNAIISLHKEFFNYYNVITNVTLDGVDFKNNIELSNYLLKITTVRHALDSELSKTLLFVSDFKITNVAVETTNFLAKTFVYDTINYIHNLSNLNIMYNKNEGYDIKYFQELAGISRIRDEGIMGKINEVSPSIVNLTNVFRDHLSKISNTI